MKQSDKEIAQTERLENDYEVAQSPIIQKITNKVCGCGYVGSSWTTQSEAKKISKYLELDENSTLLEIGAGAGWPGLYLAKQSGCHVTLLDIPVTGLEIAKKRAQDDRMSDRVTVLAGNAVSLPFYIPSFSAVSHSDVLCCLIKKQEVLKECRRVIHSSGLMAFTVISIQPDLSDQDRKQAIQVSPDFVESEVDYRTMLENTGWTLISYEDITEEFKISCQRMMLAEEALEEDLRDLKGSMEFEESKEAWELKLKAFNKGLLRRELFVVKPIKYQN